MPPPAAPQFRARHRHLECIVHLSIAMQGNQGIVIEGALVAGPGTVVADEYIPTIAELRQAHDRLYGLGRMIRNSHSCRARRKGDTCSRSIKGCLEWASSQSGIVDWNLDRPQKNLTKILRRRLTLKMKLPSQSYPEFHRGLKMTGPENRGVSVAVLRGRDTKS
jgi:hypothetical protein